MAETTEKWCILMCGIPGSGKSTFLGNEIFHYMRDNGGISIVSSDAIRGEINGDEGSQENASQVWGEVYSRAKNSKEKYVVIDATFINEKSRKNAIKRLKDSGRKMACVCIIPNLEVAKERNRKRGRVVPDEIIESMYNSFTLPTKAEGFESVSYFNVFGEEIRNG